MIINWVKFNESNNSVNYEMLSEVICFRNYSLLDDNEELIREIEYFISLDLNLDIDSLTPITSEEHRVYNLKMQELFNIIKNNTKLSSKLKSIYSKVESKMSGFPKFYEIEDVFLELIDIGWIILFDFRRGSITVEISNYQSDINITPDDYNDVKNMSKNIAKKIESLFNINCTIVDDDNYYSDDQRNIGIIVFELNLT